MLGNKYEILGIVGEGAYGYVYKAKNCEKIDPNKPPSNMFGKVLLS